MCTCIYHIPSILPIYPLCCFLPIPHSPFSSPPKINPTQKTHEPIIKYIPTIRRRAPKPVRTILSLPITPSPRIPSPSRIPSYTSSPIIPIPSWGRTRARIPRTCARVIIFKKRTARIALMEGRCAESVERFQEMLTCMIYID